MFKNPGTKIKNLAKIFFWIEVIIAALVVIALGDFLFEEYIGIVLAAVILAVGVGIAYISALFLAAFGELVETNTKLLEEAQKKNSEDTEYTKL